MPRSRDLPGQVGRPAPGDKLDWKPHPKSHTIGWNANHLAEIPGWVQGTLTGPSWDIAPAEGEPYRSPTLTTRREILELFDGLPQLLDLLGLVEIFVGEFFNHGLGAQGRIQLFSEIFGFGFECKQAGL